MQTSTKLLAVAIAAEVILISTGLGLAAVQSMAAFADHGSLTLAASAAAFPLLLAVLELFKIPAGISLYTARWVMKPFAALLLLAGTVATFETVTMAGSTWFRSLQFEVTSAQSELIALRERRDGTVDRSSQVETINAAIEAVERQLSTVTITPGVSAAEASLERLAPEIEELFARRSAARAEFAADWDAQTANNTARIQSGDPEVAEQGLVSQRSMPARQAYVDGRMGDWNANEGQLVRARIAELEAEQDAARDALETERGLAAASVALVLDDLRSERSRLQNDLMQALADDRRAQEGGIELGAAIEAQQQAVARLASHSVIYDIAAKVYGVALHDVSEEQANVTTFWVVLGVGLSTALSTGVAAILSTYLAKQKRSSGHLTALRFVEAKTRRIALRDKTITDLKKQLETERQKPAQIEYRDRVAYRYLPFDRDLSEDDMKGRLRSVKMEATDAA